VIHFGSDLDETKIKGNDVGYLSGTKKYQLGVKIRIIRGERRELKRNRKFWPKHKDVAREECGIPGS
jgi:hypothetical protein